MKNFCHSGAAGDIIYSLPTIIALGGGTLYLRERFYKILGPLLKQQPYIDNVICYNFYSNKKNLGSRGEIVTFENGIEAFNLDLYRIINKENGYKQHLAQSHLDIFGAKFDLNKEWLHVDGKRVAPIVINRTDRYIRNELDWDILKVYAEDCVFIGRSDDYHRFPLKEYIIEHIVSKKKVALQIAEAIKGSDLFIGNQSLGFALAEAMKCNRVLEVYSKKPNCMPHGENWYLELTEELIEGVVYGESS